MSSRTKSCLDVLSGLIAFSFFLVVTYNFKYIGPHFTNMTIAYCVVLMFLPCVFSLLWLTFRLTRRFGPMILGRDWPEWTDPSEKHCDMTAEAGVEGRMRLIAYLMAIVLGSALVLNGAAYLLHASGLRPLG